MNTALSVPMGVVVAREKIGAPWQPFRWRAVKVLLDPPDDRIWREIERSRDTVMYRAATASLELTTRDLMAYRINLANGEPTVYVVIREETNGARSSVPVSVERVTISPFDVHALGGQGELQTIERVPMPDRLLEIVRGFIDRGAKSTHGGGMNGYASGQANGSINGASHVGLNGSAMGPHGNKGHR